MAANSLFSQDFNNKGRLYLRVSVTGNCNFRCTYCAPEDLAKSQAGELTLEQLSELILFISSVYPLYKIRFTGGEPLTRKGIVEMIETIHAKLPTTELTLTTNGTALEKFAIPLKDAGLSRLNLSMDDIDEHGFRTVTGGGDLQKVLAGIAKASAVGFEKIKINTVLLRSRSAQSMPEMIRLANKYNAKLRFIELMPFNDDEGFYEREFITQSEGLDIIRDSFMVSEQNKNSGLAKLYHVSDDAGVDTEVGFISSVSEPFCSTCDRLRLDSQGKLHPCLRSNKMFYLHAILKEHGEEVARKELEKFVGKKAKPDDWDKRSMMALGG